MIIGAGWQGHAMPLALPCRVSRDTGIRRHQFYNFTTVLHPGRFEYVIRTIQRHPATCYINQV